MTGETWNTLTPYLIFLGSALYSWIFVHRYTKRTEQNKIKERLFNNLIEVHSTTLQLVTKMAISETKIKDELSQEKLSEYHEIIQNQAKHVFQLKSLLALYINNETMLERIDSAVDEYLNIPKEMDEMTNIKVYRIWINLIKMIKNAKLT